MFSDLWTFYLVYMIIALGQGLGSWLPLMTMLNNWFKSPSGQGDGILELCQQDRHAGAHTGDRLGNRSQIQPNRMGKRQS